MHFLESSEVICACNLAKHKFARVQHCNSNRVGTRLDSQFANFGGTAQIWRAKHLQNGQFKVFFNHKVFGAELTRLGRIYAQIAFEGATYDLVTGRVTVINVANAN